LADNAQSRQLSTFADGHHMDTFTQPGYYDVKVLPSENFSSCLVFNQMNNIPGCTQMVAEGI